MLSLLYNNTPIIKSMMFAQSTIAVYIVLSILWSYTYAALQNILYKQKLFAQQNFLILQFNIGPQYLPIPLKNISQNFDIEISIRYGPYFHRYNRNSIQIYSFNTITTQFNVLNRQIYTNLNKILIPEQLLEIIRSTFMVSLTHRYSYSFFEEGKIIYNDPNDKFCRHHIEQVIRNFLPCANFAGIAQLLQLDSFFSAGFSGKRLYGMQINWKKDGIIINFFGQIQQSNGNIQGFRRMKIGEKCLSNSIIQMSDSQLNAISLRQIVTDRIKQSFFRQQNVIRHNPKLFAIQQTQGNWYNPRKNLKIYIQTQPIFNNSVITIFQLLPYRAGVTQIILQNYYSDSTKIQHKMKCDLQNNQNQSKYKEKKIYCEVNIFINNLLLEKSKQKFQINLLLNNKLICFDNYETIFGGGTQIMNIPIKLQEYQKLSDNLQNKQFYYAGPLSLKTPQPDQSLPFQVITFTLGIFGYLWLSIWRKLSNDLKEAKQKPQILLEENKN